MYIGTLQKQLDDTKRAHAKENNDYAQRVMEVCGKLQQIEDKIVAKNKEVSLFVYICTLLFMCCST